MDEHDARPTSQFHHGFAFVETLAAADDNDLWIEAKKLLVTATEAAERIIPPEERPQPDLFPRLPGEDEPPMESWQFSNALIRALMDAEDLDLWMQFENLAQKAAAIAGFRIEP